MEKSVIMIDSETQNMLQDYLPDAQTLDQLVAFFSIFSDHNRLRIVSILALTPMCVNDIAAVLCLNQTTVSHQLKILRLSGAVKTERNGKIIMYSLSSDAIKEVMLSGVQHLYPS